MIYSFKGFVPIIKESSFIHPQATVVGNVIIGEDCYIGPGAVLRGDWGAIIIGNGCNVQENCTLHMFPGKSCTLEDAAHIGHGAIIHGATIRKNAMIGMNAVIMDDVIIGANSIVGALSFVKANTEIEDNQLVVGNPARVVRELDSKMIAWKTKGTKLYQSLPADCKEHMQEVSPLREIPEDRPDQAKLFETWESIKKE